VKVIVPKSMNVRKMRRTILRFEYGPWTRPVRKDGGAIIEGEDGRMLIFLWGAAAGLHIFFG
jgi:hypothetical protein